MSENVAPDPDLEPDGYNEPHDHSCDMCGVQLTCEGLTERLHAPCQPFDWYLCQECGEACGPLSQAKPTVDEPTITIDGETMHLRRHTYQDGGRIALDIIDAEGDVFLTLTVNFPGEPMAEGEFAIKDWSENAPYIPAIFASGLFQDTGRLIASGFVAAPVWRFLNPPEAPLPEPMPLVCDSCQEAGAVVRLTLTNLQGEVLDQTDLCKQCAPGTRVSRSCASLSAEEA